MFDAKGLIQDRRIVIFLLICILVLGSWLVARTNIDWTSDETLPRYGQRHPMPFSLKLLPATSRAENEDTNILTNNQPQDSASAAAFAFPVTRVTSAEATSPTTHLLSRPPIHPGMYVRSAPYWGMGTGQLGNSMFEYISSYTTAVRLGLTFVVMADGTQRQAYQQMSSLFRITAPLHSDPFPVDKEIVELGFGKYSPAMAQLNSYGKYTQLSGWLQSWRYLVGYEEFVRGEFALTDRYRTFVKEFFGTHGVRIAARDQMSQTLIAVHVRRGDMLKHLDQYKMAPPEYLVQAIGYFREKYAERQPVFVVATDDKAWTRPIVSEALKNVSVPVIYAEGTAEEDIAVLSSCHHAIITGGTYGWWSAWLTGGEVMYFIDFIWSGSTEWINYRAEDYYPPSWLGRK